MTYAFVFVIVSVGCATAVLWGSRTLRVCIGLLSHTGRRQRAQGVVAFLRSGQRSGDDDSPCSREYFPTYVPTDPETQGPLIEALSDVKEPISITEARATAKALSVRVDLYNLAGMRVATVEPNGSVIHARQRESGAPPRPSLSRT